MSLFSDERANELSQLFFESAQELLQALNEQALELEQRPGDTEVVRGIRRTIHTIKGDSAACGYRELSELAHEIEDVLTPEIAAHNGPLVEVVLGAADIFQEFLAAYKTKQTPPSAEGLREHVRALAARPAQPKPESAFHPTFEWNQFEQQLIDNSIAAGAKVWQIGLRIDVNCVMRDAALQMVTAALQANGVVVAFHAALLSGHDSDIVEVALESSLAAAAIERKCRIPGVVSDVHVIPAQPGQAPAQPAVAEQPSPEIPAEPSPSSPTHGAALAALAENTLRVDADRIDAVLNLVGELVIARSMIAQAATELDRRLPRDPLSIKLADAVAFQTRVLNDLQKSVMKIRMVPVEQLFRRMPRVLRDAAKSTGKEVRLEIRGEDTDLDKGVLDTLAEPLMHLVRNSVDHGIESAEERAAAGKPAEGAIRLEAYHVGNRVVIEVSDDGRGIDPARIRAKAIERGLVTADDAARLDEQGILELIFAPGFSTAEQVTEVSGRGVGMDVVKSVLERLKGSVSIESRPGQGTRFLLQVPLTLAIIKALLFRVAGQAYAIPLASVVEITRAAESEIHIVDGKEVLRLRDRVLTLARLSRLADEDELPAPEPSSESARRFIVVVADGDQRYGLVVDRLIGEEELVIKAMHDHLVATDLVSGASILGDGTVVLILHTNEVVRRFARLAPELEVAQ